MSNQIEGFIKGIFLGGLIGSAIGILYAPKSGRETREVINRKADELVTKVKKEYETTLKKSGKAYEAAVKQLKHLQSSSKEKAGEMVDKVNELTQLGKEAFHDTKGQLTKVVNDAVHTFKLKQGWRQQLRREGQVNISPLLANIYLKVIDTLWAVKKVHEKLGVRFAIYAGGSFKGHGCRAKE